MLRIKDARTGLPVDPAPARRGLTRVQVHVPGYDTTALRVLLVADLLARALELGRTPVWSLLTAPRGRPELLAGAAALGIRPFEDSRDLGPGPGQAQTIHVAGEGTSAPDGVLVAVAPVESPASAPPDVPDPAVLRLALLDRPRDLPVRLDADVLDAAANTLAHWRRAVADWARRPSRPIPDAVGTRLRAAWEDDLDAGEVLAVLRWVAEAPDVPDGARFETYAHADRLLGLELTRDLGAPS
ncbi:hypothetical protein [Streptomyces sp. NPDC005423]|uniref:hypothetical protein n=1 Tax=Streptomyces sp. NPDC005423 TaxID=3155343 RepID=UPI0033B34EC9